MVNTQKISFGFQPNQAGSKDPAIPSSAERVARSLLIVPIEVETYIPRGERSKTHIGFLIHGTFVNNHNEDIDLPSILFEIKRSDSTSNEPTETDLKVALFALNSFAILHKNLSKEQFQSQMQALNGQSFRFLGESDQESILNKPNKYLKKLRKKGEIVNIMRFFSPDPLNPGKYQYMSEKTNKTFIPIEESGKKDINQLAHELISSLKQAKKDRDIELELEEADPNIELELEEADPNIELEFEEVDPNKTNQTDAEESIGIIGSSTKEEQDQKENVNALEKLKPEEKVDSNGMNVVNFQPFDEYFLKQMPVDWAHLQKDFYQEHKNNDRNTVLADEIEKAEPSKDLELFTQKDAERFDQKLKQAKQDHILASWLESLRLFFNNRMKKSL